MSHLLVTSLTPESLQMEAQTPLKGNTNPLQPKAKEASFLLHYSESVFLPRAKDMFLRRSLEGGCSPHPMVPKVHFVLNNDQERIH